MAGWFALMNSHPNHPRDPNHLAKSIIDVATGQSLVLSMTGTRRGEACYNEQRAKPDQEHSRLSQFIAAPHNRTWIPADGGRIVPAAGTIVAVRVLDRPARINLLAFSTKRNVSGSPHGPSAFIGD